MKRGVLHCFVSGIALWGASTMVTAAPTPRDGAIANPQQILYWLEKRGELAANASIAQQQQALADYMQGGRLSKTHQKQVQEYHRLRDGAFARSQQVNRGKLQRVAASGADVSKTVKVLAVLVDFPDLPYNSNRLTAADTQMFYASYPATHYRDLLFSTAGFNGPSGQQLTSAYQYYQAVSGNSFHFTGDVKGWFRAAHDAAYYGANDPDNDDSDMRVTTLVEEAVAQAAASMSATELASYDVEDPYDLDGDGNLDEADGIIDHVMVFHSSIGEEAGGGVLGADAIWSHRYFVTSSNSFYGQPIPGTSKRVFGYTIQPIDSAVGVCVHEFGHDLGLPDEYDTSSNGDGEPVGSWSLMSNGSWTGSPAGAAPTGFSPYARDFLQQRYQGRWLNAQTIDYASLTAQGRDVTLYQATDADRLNQLEITLPAGEVALSAPYAGNYQYYSGRGNELNHALSFEVQLPVSSNVRLTMQARWDMEEEFDYGQLLVDGVAIAGNYTRSSNSANSARNIITGESASLPAADGHGWVTLDFDLSAYAGAKKQISLIYKTDESISGDGIQIDNIRISDDASVIFADDAEQHNEALQLTDFIRTGDSRPGKGRSYLVQLRSHGGIDSGLKLAGYDPGVLVWLRDEDQDDNNVQQHPGEVFIGVVDADQQLISGQPTLVQIHDAAFSFYDQHDYQGDTSLTANSTFDDREDYSAPQMPQAGIKLPALGVKLEIISQETDSSMATVRISRVTATDGGDDTPEVLPLTARINVDQQGQNVSFSSQASGGVAPYRYQWQLGDGNGSTLATVSHTYAAAGSYNVTLTITDSNNSTSSANATVVVTIPSPNVTPASSSGGGGSMGMAWLLGLLAVALGRRR
ncbi:immune inhibitor A domain-containing protein [Shewanella sp. YIC-542]|uniref:immune inhibitor A domain-containing protein n=1 Tax=Shewanella mytili TaxID=3377111 RepID=UPI00398E6906